MGFLGNLIRKKPMDTSSLQREMRETSERYREKEPDSKWATSLNPEGLKGITRKKANQEG